MQEHFNENYMESEIYPNASFNGSIVDWSQNKISERANEVVISGEMTIHGVTKKLGNLVTYIPIMTKYSAMQHLS